MVGLHTAPLHKQRVKCSSGQASAELCDTYIYTHVLTHADAHGISFFNASL